MPDTEIPAIPDRERDIAHERKQFADLVGHEGLPNQSQTGNEPSQLGRKEGGE